MVMYRMLQGKGLYFREYNNRVIYSVVQDERPLFWVVLYNNSVIYRVIQEER